MARVKRGKNKNKKRKKILKKTKGYKWGRNSKKRAAKQAHTKARRYAFDHRRDKKNDFRRRWQVLINGAVRDHDLSYSKFIHLLKESNVELDRKVLADMVQHHPDTFARVVEQVKK